METDAIRRLLHALESGKRWDAASSAQQVRAELAAIEAESSADKDRIAELGAALKKISMLPTNPAPEDEEAHLLGLTARRAIAIAADVLTDPPEIVPANAPSEHIEINIHEAPLEEREDYRKGYAAGLAAGSPH